MVALKGLVETLKRPGTMTSRAPMSTRPSTAASQPSGVSGAKKTPTV